MQPEQPTEINVGPQHVYSGQNLKIWKPKLTTQEAEKNKKKTRKVGGKWVNKDESTIYRNINSRKQNWPTNQIFPERLTTL